MDCSEKTTVRSDEDKRSLINRLSRIEGQIRGVKAMIEADKYCKDILVQSSAISHALDSFNREILDAHVKGCVVRDVRNGKDEVVDELIELVHRLMR